MPMRRTPSLLLHSQSFGQSQRVEASIPGEDSALSKKCCDFRRVVLAKAQRQRRAPLIESLRINDPENPGATNRVQALDQLRNEGPFVWHDCAVSRSECLAPVPWAFLAAPSQFCKIFHRCLNSRNELMDLRPRFPALRRRIRCGPHFVRLEAFQVLFLAVEC